MLQSGSVPSVFHFSLSELETATYASPKMQWLIVLSSGFCVLERRGVEMRIVGCFSSNPHGVCTTTTHPDASGSSSRVMCVETMMCERGG